MEYQEIVQIIARLKDSLNPDNNIEYNKSILNAVKALEHLKAYY